MSASSTNSLAIVSVSNSTASLADGRVVALGTLTRQNLLRAAKVRFPETDGRLWWSVSSADVLFAIQSGDSSGVLAEASAKLASEAPTERQAAFLNRRGIEVPASKAEASKLIGSIKASETETTAAPSVTIGTPVPTPTAPVTTGGVEAAIAELVRSVEGTKVDTETVRQIVRDELSNMPQHATTLEVRIGTETHKVEGRTHKVFPKVLAYAARGYHVLLVGPAGSGKSTLAQQVFAALGHDGEIPAISFGPTTPTSKLFGYNDANGATHRTPYWDAYENGTPFLGDELDNGHAGLVAELNQALANGAAAFAGGQVKQGPGHVFIGTANTYGRGGDRMFVGRNQLDAATLDRFVKVTVDYDEDLEAEIAFSLVTESDRAKAQRVIDKVRRHRANVLAAHLPVVVSPRSLLRAVDVVCNAGIELDDALDDAYLGGLSDDLRAKVTA